MNHKKERTQRGQVMVLLVFAMIALLGFTALAIDGSMMFSDRRFAQNGADASSLAGGGSVSMDLENAFVTAKTWDCDSESISDGMAAAATAAIARAADNGFVIQELDPAADLTGETNYVTVECVNNDIPGPRDEQFIDIRVVLEMQTNTAFVHFVYKGAVVQHVEAVTRVLPRRHIVFGNAVVALNDLPCSGNSNGNIFNGVGGGGNVTVSGGGVWSNGCLNLNGNPDIDLINGDISFFETDDWTDLQTDVNFDGGGFDWLEDESLRIQASDYALPEEPNCDHPDAHNVTFSQPNDPDGVVLNTPGPISGLWCITGDVKLTASDVLWGEQVTLYFIDGNLEQAGNATIMLTAVDVYNTAYDGPAIKGVAVYSGQDAPPANPGQPSQMCQIDVTGNSQSFIYGTIMAPACNVKANGSSETGINGQVIGWNVEAGGSSGTSVVFDDTMAISTPTFLALWR